jgi:hypothetical protein
MCERQRRPGTVVSAMVFENRQEIGTFSMDGLSVRLVGVYAQRLAWVNVDGASGRVVMDAVLLNTVRRERTSGELTALTTAVKTWIAERRRLDRDVRGVYIGRHKTQLEALESVLGAASETVREGIDSLKTDRDSGDFFDVCRSYDQVIVWLARVWTFFKQKFDQRDDLVVGPIVKAADELVWSCYHAALRSTARRH